MNEDAQFMMIRRSADLAVLAVEMVGMEPVAATPGGMPRLRATGRARIHLGLPPQAIVESLLALPGLAESRLGGPSTLAFAITAGTEFDLTAAGLLGAVARAGVVIPSAAMNDGRSVIEMPWGVLGSPSALVSGATLESVHSAAPSTSTRGVTGVWRTALQAEGGVGYRPLFVRPDALAAPVALSGLQRGRILDESRSTLVKASLALSALGGSGSFHLVAPLLTWTHDIATGRDVSVRFVAEGMLYPFGHRALLLETTERLMAEEPGGAAAGLVRTQQRIVVTQRVRAFDRADFPFGSVEILSEAIDFATHGLQIKRPVPDATGPLQTRLAEAIGEQDTLYSSIQERLGAIPNPPSLEWLAEQGDSDVQDYLVAWNSVQELEAELANIDWTTADPTGVAAEQAKLREASKEEKRLRPIAYAHLASLPRTIAQLRDSGDSDALQYFALIAEIADLKTKIAAGQAASQQEREVAFLPLGADGIAVAVPVRLRGTLGPVEFALALMFVVDFTWQVDPDGEYFSSLGDASTGKRIRDAWAPYGEVTLPSVLVDLVRKPPQQPGDVHEVCGWQLTGAGYDPNTAAYAPKLGRIDVRLRGWRMLLPGQTDRTSLTFPAVARLGDVALDITTPTAIDFTGHADLAGGLAVPKVAVDGISRSTGPVPTGALPGASADAWRRIYSDTTVLGFTLSDLLAGIATGAVPEMPFMRPVEGPGGSVGVRFEWSGLRLRSNGVFRIPAAGEPGAGEPSTLEVVATVTPEHSETRCTLTRFGLVLPPVAAIVQLDFTSLSCLTTPGRPPSVDIAGLKVTFLGPLKLLNGLQERLQSVLQGSGVSLVRTADGIQAGYAVSIPDVTAGAFVLQNVDASVVVDIPFTGRRVSVTLAFARPDNPFRLAVLAFGGGGYAAVRIEGDKVARVDVSLDFGAVLAVNFKVANAEVHVVGGLSITGDANGVLLVAFLRMGGSIQLLGVVSLSVELKLLLAYDDVDGANRLVGRARLVVEIDLLFFSKSLELDTGEWVIEGGSAPASPNRGRSVPVNARTASPDAPVAFGSAPPGPARADVDVGAAMSNPDPDPDEVGLKRWLAYQTAFSKDFA